MQRPPALDWWNEEHQLSHWGAMPYRRLCHPPMDANEAGEVERPRRVWRRLLRGWPSYSGSPVAGHVGAGGPSLARG